MKTEGMLVVGTATAETDFSVGFFNPDGSSGMMCGNGGRCAAAFAASIGLVGREGVVTFDLSGTKYSARFTGRGVRLSFPPAKVFRRMIISTKFGNISGAYLDVGTDHFVIDFADLLPKLAGSGLIEKEYWGEFASMAIAEQLRSEHFDLRSFAREVRYHDAFAPLGTNVNLFAETGDCFLELRTFERGVEAETGACGTGAISTAVCYGRMNRDVQITPPSGDPLWVNVADTEIMLEGSAVVLEKRTIEI